MTDYSGSKNYDYPGYCVPCGGEAGNHRRTCPKAKADLNETREIRSAPEIGFMSGQPEHIMCGCSSEFDPTHKPEPPAGRPGLVASLMAYWKKSPKATTERVKAMIPYIESLEANQRKAVELPECVKNWINRNEGRSGFFALDDHSQAVFDYLTKLQNPNA